MAITLRKTVAARELPTDWQREGQFAPEDQVTVTVAPASQGTSCGSLRRFIGAGQGLFPSARAIDEHLDRQRDEWAS
ncbi:MAG TPA: hypothetical protein VFY87_20630 [Geminicoccaceae bacterium]|jgi:hypothetical protein|nr:hypothetical protein [Geminicoccaceae bacterium]